MLSGSSSVAAVLKPLNPSIATTSARSRQALGAGGEPGLERLLRAALDHVQQPCWAGAVTDRGEVDDHRDVRVASPGVAPYVFVDAEDPDAVEAGDVVDQDPSAFCKDGVVRGVLRDPEPVSDAGHGEVLHHDRQPSPTPLSVPPVRGEHPSATHLLHSRHGPVSIVRKEGRKHARPPARRGAR